MDAKPFTLQTELTNYMPIPRSVLALSLPFTAVVLYGVLLDRGTCSRKNGYAEDGCIYVVYPILELTEYLGLSTTAIKTHLTTLEHAGLIRRVRRWRKDANRIFLYLPEDAVTATGTDTGRDAIPTSDRRKSVPGRERIPAPSNRKKQHRLNNNYQHKQEESL